MYLDVLKEKIEGSMYVLRGLADLREPTPTDTAQTEETLPEEVPQRDAEQPPVAEPQQTAETQQPQSQTPQPQQNTENDQKQL